MTETKKMKLVKAIEKGFYGGVLWAEGTSFHVPEDERATWFHAEGEEPLPPVDFDEVLKRNTSTDDEGLRRENEALRKKFESLQKTHKEESDATKLQLEELKEAIQTLTEAATAPQDDKAPKK